MVAVEAEDGVSCNEAGEAGDSDMVVDEVRSLSVIDEEDLDVDCDISKCPEDTLVIDNIIDPFLL